MNWRLSGEDEGEEKGGEAEMKGGEDKGRADRVKGMDGKGSRENVTEERCWKGRERERERHGEVNGEKLMMGGEEGERVRRDKTRYGSGGGFGGGGMFVWEVIRVGKMQR